MKINKLFNILNILKASKYAIQGLWRGVNRERAITQETILCIMLFIISWQIATNKIELILLNIPLFILLITEYINTAIEKTVDRISLEKNILSGYIKDLASAAVLLSILLLIFVWSIILLF